jgi:hypothetical protein
MDAGLIGPIALTACFVHLVLEQSQNASSVRIFGIKGRPDCWASGHCASTRVRCRMVNRMRGRRLISLSNNTRALSRLLPPSTMKRSLYVAWWMDDARTPAVVAVATTSYRETGGEGLDSRSWRRSRFLPWDAKFCSPAMIGNPFVMTCL